MRAPALSFATTFAGMLVAAGAAALIVGCGSISVVADGGAGGNTAVITGSGGEITSAGGHTGAGGATAGTGGMMAGAGGSGAGGVIGTGGTPGTGGSVDAGCICPDIVMPVCGSDGRTFNNACLAGCAGVTVAHQGACVDAGVDTGAVACAAVRGCCSMDSDCNTNEECAGVACGANGRASGVCKAKPNQNGNRCWTDADCAARNNGNNTCMNAQVCPCNAVCVRADTLGTCN